MTEAERIILKEVRKLRLKTRLKYNQADNLEEKANELEESIKKGGSNE